MAAHWTKKPTKAGAAGTTALDVVDGLLSYMSTGRGKPSADERSIFAAAIVFSYGVWENYAEQLAIEVVRSVSIEIAPARVPQEIHQRIEKNQSTWALAVSPGWQGLWVRKVERQALGDDERYGLNTARSGQVKALLAFAGVPDAFDGVDDSIVPEHLAKEAETAVAALDALVDLRGEIVHTAKVPTSLKKHHAREWREFVKKLIAEVDQVSRSQCQSLLGL